MDTRSFKSLSILAAVAAAALSTAIVAADAQGMSKLEARVSAAVAKIRAACGEDLQKYCSTVTPGEGRLLLCIEAHEDKISSKCEYALFDAVRNLGRALDRIEMTADACWGDIEKHCVDVAPGGGGIARCLVGKKTSLSKRCQTQIGKMQAAR